MMLRSSLAIMAATVMLVGAAPESQPLFDTPKVIDGDTMIVSGERVHLWAIDAPELGQMCERGGKRYACGQESRKHLEKLIGKGTVSCQPEGLRSDHGGEWVGICVVSDQPCWLAVPCAGDRAMSLNRLQLIDGHAIDLEGHYSEDEEEAETARRGLWAGRFDEPEQWRAGKRRIN